MIRAKKVSQLLLTLEDKPGLLAQISDLIASNNINIDNMYAYSKEGKAYFMIITNNNEEIKNIFKAKKWKVDEEYVITVDLENRPGALRNIAVQLKEKKINIKYCYGTSYEGEGPCHFIFKAEDNNKALLSLK